jgi:hypothetical protein
MTERRGSFRTVVADPNLRRVELAFLGFNMTEFATWIAILVYAYERGGAAAMGAVSVILLVPSAFVAPRAGSRSRAEVSTSRSRDRARTSARSRCCATSRGRPVIALTPSRLLALEREPFLLAVTGHPVSHEAARNVASARAR